MPKRFTETEKWKDKWFRSLTCEFKLAYLYLLDNCDHAGVIDLDDELANFQIGTNVDWQAFYKTCEDRVSVLHNGKVWLHKFIEYQYGELSKDCKAHNPVFSSIKKNDLESKFERVSKGYRESIERDQDTYKDKDKDIDKDKDQDNSELDQLENSETEPRPKTHSPEFKQVWNLWKKHLRETHKPLAPAAEEVQLMNLGRCFDSDEERIAAVLFSIERQARNLITNGDHKRYNEKQSFLGGVAGGGTRGTQRAPTDLTGVFD
jgi:hypothetical protein